jgi:hypothetical protein
MARFGSVHEMVGGKTKGRQRGRAPSRGPQSVNRPLQVHLADRQPAAAHNGGQLSLHPYARHEAVQLHRAGVAPGPQACGGIARIEVQFH